MKQTIVPATSFQFLDPIQAKPAKTNITNGHGELTNSFSNQTRNINKGSKNPSMPSP